MEGGEEIDREGRYRTGEAGAGPTHGMCLGGCRQPGQGVLPSTRTFACVCVCVCVFGEGGREGRGRGGRAEKLGIYFQKQDRAGP